ncbi:unnamed protein product [Phaeothamnion confervicola]
MGQLCCARTPDYRRRDLDGTWPVAFRSDGADRGGGARARARLLPEQPKWLADEESTCCHACGAAFDVIERRHHCRRCRNLFCGRCSNFDSRLLLFGLNKPVRVCGPCAKVAVEENRFCEEHLPTLQEVSLRRFGGACSSM